MSIGINVEQTKIYISSELNADPLQFRLRIKMASDLNVDRQKCLTI